MKEKGWIFVFAIVLALCLSVVPASARQDELKRAEALDQQAKDLYQQGRYEEAIPLAKETLAIKEKSLGPEHPDTAESLNNLAMLYLFMENYAQAEPLYQKALAIREKALGSGHPDTAQSLHNIAELYRLLGDYEKAAPLCKKALAIVEKTQGLNHPDTASNLNNLAELYRAMGDYTEAELLHKRALAIREKTLGREHPDTAESLNNLALLYEAMGDYDRAELLYQDALDILELALAPNHPNFAIVMDNLSELYISMGDYARAEPLKQKILAIQEDIFGPEHHSTASSVKNLALIYQNTGDYTRAESMYKRALAIDEKVLGLEHPSTASTLNNLAALYVDIGDYTQAEPLYIRALVIRENTIGPEHPSTATNLNNLASLYLEMCEYDKAEQLAKRALAIREKILGPEHPDTALSLNTLALLYKSMGDYAKAEPLFLRAGAVVESVFGPEHHRTATNLNNLANLYTHMGIYDQAESLYLRTLEIQEKVLCIEHINTATTMSNLADLYSIMGENDRAEPLFKRSLAIFEKAFGPEHPNVVGQLNNLAVMFLSMDDFVSAEPLFRRALAIREKALGAGHPRTAIILENLGVLKAYQGEYTSAHDLLTRAQKISTKLIELVMSFTSEDQKLKFLATQQADLEGAISLVVAHLPKNKRAIQDILDAWLCRKGIILEAQRRYQEALVYSDAPEVANIFQELSAVRSQLSRLMFSGSDPAGLKEYRKKIALLEEREKELEANLSTLSQAYAQQKKVKQADTQQVAGALPQDSVLLEFAQIHPFDFQGTVGPSHYLAFVLRAGDAADVELFDLGEAKPIDQMVTELKFALADSGDAKGERARLIGHRLYALVFAKLEKELGSAKDIFISPDGNLNLIPFEILLRPDGKYLIEEYSFNYLASGRDLIGFGMVEGEPGLPLILGDPDFDLDEPSKEIITRQLGLEPDREVLQARRSLDLRGVRFMPLPGTGEEIEAIGAILGPDVEIFTGKEALEEVLTFRKNSPRILHLATHGFFLTDQQSKILFDSRTLQFTSDAPILAETRIDNPLLRSGLAMAGANQAFDSDYPQGSDGLFTAEEAIGLRLHGTELVVLSACNTGTGEVRTGEGVYGLRRAFVQAGAKGLVMSMWPVPDQETKELMVLFYKNIEEEKMNRCKALRQAALDEMKVVEERYGHTNPAYWGAFVYLGEP